IPSYFHSRSCLHIREPSDIIFLRKMRAYMSSSKDSFIFNHPAITETYTLSLHDALPISNLKHGAATMDTLISMGTSAALLWRCRSEEHTSELQSRFELVCRLLLEKKKNNKKQEQ